jgi:hypothetical protein
VTGKRAFVFSWEVVWKRPGVKHEFLRPSLVKIRSLRKDVERTSNLLSDTVWSLRFVLLDTQWGPNLMRSVGLKHYEMFATRDRSLSSEGQVEGTRSHSGKLKHFRFYRNGAVSHCDETVDACLLYGWC